MKKSGEDRLKCAVYESTLSTADAVPLPRGEGYDTGMPLSHAAIPSPQSLIPSYQFLVPSPQPLK